jgi:hypothetical protein
MIELREGSYDFLSEEERRKKEIFKEYNLLLRNLKNDHTKGEMKGLSEKAEIIHGNETEKIKLFNEVIDVGGLEGYEALIKAAIVYGEDTDKMKTFTEVIKEKGPEASAQLIEAHSEYEDDIEKFNAFADVAREYGAYHMGKLLSVRNAHKGNVEVMKIFLEVLEENGEKAFRELADSHDLYENDPDKCREVVAELIGNK